MSQNQNLSYCHLTVSNWQVYKILQMHVRLLCIALNDRSTGTLFSSLHPSVLFLCWLINAELNSLVESSIDDQKSMKIMYTSNLP